MSRLDQSAVSAPRRLLRRPKVQSVASQATYVLSIAALNVVVVRVWGAQERGEMASITVGATLIATAAGLGLTDVLVWRGGQSPQPLDVSPRFRRSLISVSALGLAAAGVTAAALDDPIGWLVAPWAISLHLFRASMSTHLADGDFGRFNRDRTALPLLSTAVVLAGVGLRDVHPVALVLAGQLLAVVLFHNWRSGQLRLTGPLRGAAPGETSVARNSVVGNLAGLSLARVDVLLVAALLGSKEAGVYAVALAVGDGAMVASYGLMFHAMHEGATDRQVSRRTMRASVGSSALLALAAAVALHLLDVRVLGPDFEGVALTFALLIPGITAMGYVRVRYAADLTGGVGNRATLALLGAIVVLVGFDLALVPSLGIDGAAVGSSLAYLAAALTIARRAQPTTLPMATTP